MKKLWGIIFTILGIFLAFQAPTVVKADKYQIKKYDETAKILKDGNVDLTQRITYEFTGDFHGVYYTQDLKGTKGTTEPQVSVDMAGKQTYLKQSESGQNNTFKVSKNKKKMDIKVYHDVSFQTVTFVYKYRLAGVVTNYLDTAEMNWRMIGNGWDNQLNNIKLTVQLPSKNVSQLKAWTHGSLDGYTKVDKKNGRVVMKLDHNPANAYVESHVIFPTAVTANNQNIVKKNAKSKILAGEKKLADGANISRQRREWIYWILMALGVVVILIIYLYRIIAIRNNQGHKHVIPTPLYHVFDEPKFSPSFTKVILDRSDRADSLALTADLMDEVGKRRMKIEKVGRTYEITALVPPTNEFFKYLINDIGNGKKVNLKQIKYAAKTMTSKDKLSKRFENWAKDAAKGREKYLDLTNMRLVDDFRISAIATDIILGIMFVISVIFGKNILITGVIAVILGSSIWGFYWIAQKRITPYTDLGEEEVNKIRAFKRMLSDIDDIKMAEVGDLILWEQFLPYAVVFGVSDKVIKALKVNFDVAEIDNSLVVPFYMGGAVGFMSAGTGGFQSSFVGAISAGGVSSSVSGGSGGFSGGTSGGFGGGSGGGAF
ncbi:DUF2207 domain-containing protein [Companilactobacillus kimchiensis]|uniref:Integral membrane protein n=1 Tax=Companilactobacillus kimchiensis TaxID=993692 RepID=A0A0R2LFD6_9LACO|nr:DUF2207 domain-containing protein [Companilactobacillus kimchiensis]KRN97367.1 integral membrane protein [Companilactobacillus kimchiensis]